MVTYRLKLLSKGAREIEDWWAEKGLQVPEPSSRVEEISNQVSFCNYDLKNAGLRSLEPTTADDEFNVSAAAEALGTALTIANYHGFQSAALPHLRMLQEHAMDIGHPFYSMRETAEATPLVELLLPNHVDEMLRQDHPFQRIEAVWRAVVLPGLFGHLPPGTASALSGVVFGILPGVRASSVAVAFSPAAPIVLLHSSLIRAARLWQLTKIRGGQFTTGIQMIMLQFHGPYSVADYGVLEAYDRIAPEELPSVVPDTMSFVLFAVAHEYAHIHLGHLSDTKSRHLLSHIPSPAATWRQRQELDADEQALRWLSDVDPDPGAIRPDYPGAWALEAAADPEQRALRRMDALVLLNIVEALSSQPGPMSSHPTALSRLKHARDYLVANRLAKASQLNPTVEAAASVIASLRKLT